MKISKFGGRLIEAKPYRVVWEIDVYAENKVEAAEQARDIQRREDSTANVFKVYDNTNEDVGEVAPGFDEIDLDKEIA